MSEFAPTVGVHTTSPKSMPAEHAALPVWNAEDWFYEDFMVGHKIRSLRRTISEGESMQFNALVTDMHPYGLVLYCEHLQRVKYRNAADFTGKTNILTTSSPLRVNGRRAKTQRAAPLIGEQSAAIRREFGL